MGQSLSISERIFAPSHTARIIVRVRDKAGIIEEVRLIRAVLYDLKRANEFVDQLRASYKGRPMTAWVHGRFDPPRPRLTRQ